MQSVHFQGKRSRICPDLRRRQGNRRKRCGDACQRAVQSSPSCSFAFAISEPPTTPVITRFRSSLRYTRTSGVATCAIVVISGRGKPRHAHATPSGAKLEYHPHQIAQSCAPASRQTFFTSERTTKRHTKPVWHGASPQRYESTLLKLRPGCVFDEI